MIRMRKHADVRVQWRDVLECGFPRCSTVVRGAPGCSRRGRVCGEKLAREVQSVQRWMLNDSDGCWREDCESLRNGSVSLSELSEQTSSADSIQRITRTLTLAVIGFADEGFFFHVRWLGTYLCRASIGIVTYRTWFVGTCFGVSREYLRHTSMRHLKLKEYTCERWWIEFRALTSRLIVHGRMPFVAISMICRRTRSGNGRPLMNTPPSWFTRPWPARRYDQYTAWIIGASYREELLVRLVDTFFCYLQRLDTKISDFTLSAIRASVMLLGQRRTSVCLLMNWLIMMMSDDSWVVIRDREKRCERNWSIEERETSEQPAALIDW